MAGKPGRQQIALNAGDGQRRAGNNDRHLQFAKLDKGGHTCTHKHQERTQVRHGTGDACQNTPKAGLFNAQCQKRQPGQHAHKYGTYKHHKQELSYAAMELVHDSGGFTHSCEGWPGYFDDLASVQRANGEHEIHQQQRREALGNQHQRCRGTLKYVIFDLEGFVHHAHGRCTRSGGVFVALIGAGGGFNFLCGGLRFFHHAFPILGAAGLILLKLFDGHRYLVQHSHGFLLQGNTGSGNDTDKQNQHHSRRQGAGYSQPIDCGDKGFEGVAD